MLQKSEPNKKEGGIRSTNSVEKQSASKASKSVKQKLNNSFTNIPLYSDKGQVQTKLQVNSPGDKYEKEADAVADKVVNTPANSSLNENYLSARSQVHSKPLSNQITPLSQSNNNQGISQEMNSKITSTKGQGKKMDDNTSSFMSGRFGKDFSQVKIHSDSEAANMSSDVNARAFTVGSDIYFNKGEFNPGTPKGDRLLAHELTHVAQQTKSEPGIQRDDPAAADPAAAAAAAVEAKKKADAITKIKTHGVSTVEDGDATFTSGELDLVNKALSGLPPADKIAIKGVKVVRVKSLGATTGGRYSNTQGFSGTTVTDEQKIEISDLAFGTNTPEESIRLIQHEVGHAIAAMPRRVAASEQSKAGAKFNDLVEKANVAVIEFNTANDETNAAITEFNATNDTLNEAITAKDKAGIAAGQKELAAKRVTVNRLRATSTAKEGVMNSKQAKAKEQEKVLQTATAAADAKFANIDDLKTDASAKLTSMVSQFQANNSTLNSTDTDSADYRASVIAAEEAIKKFYDENVTIDVDVAAADAAKSIVDSAIGERNKKRDALNAASPNNTVVGTLTALETAQDSCFKAATIVAFNKMMNLRVRKFYDFVTQKGISPALTTYAATNWPHKPEEFYAEAYSFFVSKPKELEAHSKDLFEWFKAGSYK